jgi:hypothetical protein
MNEVKSEMTRGGEIMKSEFCENCGCQKDEDCLNYRLCEDCLEDWATENEVYL